MIASRTLLALSLPLLLAACSARNSKKEIMGNNSSPNEAPNDLNTEAPTDVKTAAPTGVNTEAPINAKAKTDAEWRKQLTPEQYRILREAGTERAHGEVYETFKHQGQGTYRCAGCDALLFSSEHKFDSGCGWPSFYDPAKAENVLLKKDYSFGGVRIEVVCANCGGHLGHVFEGEGFSTPTDQRYCINGGALKFVPAANP